MKVLYKLPSILYILALLIHAFILLLAEQGEVYNGILNTSDRSPWHKRACILVQSKNFKVNFYSVLESTGVYFIAYFHLSLRKGLKSWRYLYLFSQILCHKKLSQCFLLRLFCTCR